MPKKEVDVNKVMERLDESIAQLKKKSPHSCRALLRVLQFIKTGREEG